MRILKAEDVVAMLRSEVKQAGGPGAWSKKTGIHRTTISKVLMGAQPPTKSIISTLKLRTVFVAEAKTDSD